MVFHEPLKSTAAGETSSLSSSSPLEPLVYEVGGLDLDLHRLGGQGRLCWGSRTQRLTQLWGREHNHNYCRAIEAGTKAMATDSFSGDSVAANST